MQSQRDMQQIDKLTHESHIPDWALLATVFVTGGCVLIIELMGTRILAPYFGSGIYTWSALIAITLAALALGYSFGGRLADRLPKTTMLYSLCLAAGLWTLSTPMLARALLPLLAHIPDIRVGVLISSTVLYFPNLFLLGAIGPYVIRLMTRRRENAGSVSGLVFAISTIGSLTGALVTGFMLIPHYGVQAIFTFSGALLLALAIFGNFRPKFIGYAIFLASIVVALIFFSRKQPDENISIEILEEVPSFYGQLQVIRRGKEKALLVDGIGQNYVYDGNSYATPYINFVSALPVLSQRPVKPARKALVIGLGAGQLTMLLQQAGFDVDAVEIDPEVGELAKKHFGFSLPPEHIHYMDGRLFLLRDRSMYEYIVLDAFSAEQIASHLLSREALSETSAHLTETGLLAINVTSVITGNDIGAIQHTLQTVFPHVHTFSLDSGHELTSIVFIASRSPIQLSRTDTSLSHSQLAAANRFIAGELPDLHSGVLLTDDYNPLSFQRRNIQLLWREAMIDYLGDGNMGWLML
jgi:predicted membrane-bound spermidine synthase